jgi:hypothetical protein
MSVPLHVSSATEFPLSSVFLLALAAFCMVLLAVMIDAVFTVSRKPAWHDGLHALEKTVKRETSAARSEQPPLTDSAQHRQPVAVPAVAAVAATAVDSQRAQAEVAQTGEAAAAI